MKNILLLIIVVLTVAGCGSDNKEIYVEDFNMPMQKYGTSYDSKYITTLYNHQDKMMFGLYKNTENLIRREENKIWEKPVEIIKETINIGYGETVEAEYNPYVFLFFPGETYNTYVMYTDKYGHAYYYFYNEDGELLHKSKITVSDISYSVLKPCPWDISKAIVIISKINTPTENKETIIEYSKNGEEKQFTIQRVPGNNYMSYQKWTKINNNNYFVPSGKYLFIFSLNNDTFTETSEINIEKYVGSLYPNEIKAPKFETEGIEVFSDYSIVSIKVTLFSGITDIIKVKINNETGEFI